MSTSTRQDVSTSDSFPHSTLADDNISRQAPSSSSTSSAAPPQPDTTASTSISTATASTAATSTATNATGTSAGTEVVGEHEDAAQRKHPSGVLPVVNNVVARVDLKAPLNLKTIALNVRNAEYNPLRFPAVIIRIHEPRATALAFSNGKMVVVGARSVQLAKQGARKFARIIHKLGFPVRFSGFEVLNIVADCRLNFPIGLERLAAAHPQFCSYEPELFSGLTFRLIRPKVSLVVFVTGSVKLLGARSREDLYRAFDVAYPVLLEFRKDVRPASQ
eukprot:CAMPEP_0174243726 /NCGR_PEP_ID=MMETSP0417-20130205/32616_1 /TAXON_ID=242541 /ORGANISM="Mayorella sp, Strain BSH-02190019" /LENGTH=275 /DNA_ID=CAMNT_0015323295 /DNA_START=83 /DNA_END=907 /DNA_ORIENTATION=+